jgi:hypothetical protein
LFLGLANKDFLGLDGDDECVLKSDSDFERRFGGHIRDYIESSVPSLFESNPLIRASKFNIEYTYRIPVYENIICLATVGDPIGI